MRWPISLVSNLTIWLSQLFDLIDGSFVESINLLLFERLVSGDFVHTELAVTSVETWTRWGLEVWVTMGTSSIAVGIGKTTSEAKVVGTSTSSSHTTTSSESLGRVMTRILVGASSLVNLPSWYHSVVWVMVAILGVGSAVTAIHVVVLVVSGLWHLIVILKELLRTS